MFSFVIEPALYSNDIKWILTDSIQNQKGEPDYLSIACADSNNCNALGNWTSNRVYCRFTTNGGKSWRSYLPDTSKVASYNDNATCISYPDTNLCVVGCDYNYILRSTDKCLTWELLFFPELNKIRQIKMLNAQFGVLITSPDYLIDSCQFFITNDSVKTWKKYS